MGQCYTWRITWACLTRMEGKSVLAYIMLSGMASLTPMSADLHLVWKCILHVSCSHTGRSSQCSSWSMMTLLMLPRMMPHNKGFVSCLGSPCKIGYPSALIAHSQLNLSEARSKNVLRCPGPFIQELPGPLSCVPVYEELKPRLRRREMSS